MMIRRAFAGLALAAAITGNCFAAGVELVRNGKPRATIYVAGPLEADPPPKRRRGVPFDYEMQARTRAVRDLNYHLEKMSGASLPVVLLTADGKIKGPAIILGQLAAKLGAKPTKTSPSKDGFRLLTKGAHVLIGGESDRAVRHGVYELLQRLGCEWVMPGEIGEIIPRRTTVKTPAIDVAQAPSYFSRGLWYRGYNQPRLPAERTRFAQWMARQKGGTWSAYEGYAGGHAWAGFIGRHKKEFAADPTMLALRRDRNGEMVRMGPQLESSHPRVVELFVEDIKKSYQKNIEAGKWTKDTAAGFGIGPSDGLGYSESAEALMASSGKIDPVVGELDRTDLLILLGNRILAEVKKEYPNAYVGFYSYSTHAGYPTRYKPDPNIVQIFAPINFSRFHSVLDSGSKTQTYYRSVVEQWGRTSREQGNVLTYRGYSWNLADNMLPYTKVKIWGDELPWYHHHGIRALKVEGTKMWAINGPSDFVFMKLAWDSSRDWRKLLHDYCQAAYGAGAPQLERYFLRLIETQHGAGQEAGSYHAFHLIYDDAWVKQGYKDFEAALAAAKTEGDKTRIRYSRYGVEVLELYLKYHAATLRFDFPAAKAGYEAMVAHWQKFYDTNTDLVANEAPGYLRRFMLKFVDGGLKYSSAPYSLVHAIPDELPTMFDPHEVGHEMNYHSPAINDSRFVRTRTISTTWDAQGLAGIRSGAVWYRIHFTLPAAAKDQPIGLFVGSVEDEARVWINGKLIGTSGRGFSRPFLFDLTDGILYQGDNLLAIQVVRNSKANEIGLGGIIRPSFIFSGPRLEQASRKPLDLGRVLPGGEVEKPKR